MMRSNKRERVKKAIALMIEHCNDKYFDLVWYARRDKSELIEKEQYEIIHTMQKIEDKYPEEIKRLTDFESGDWEHGFNSGMLATSRLYLSMIEEDVEQALEEFPFLDS